MIIKLSSWKYFQALKYSQQKSKSLSKHPLYAFLQMLDNIQKFQLIAGKENPANVSGLIPGAAWMRYRLKNPERSPKQADSRPPAYGFATAVSIWVLLPRDLHTFSDRKEKSSSERAGIFLGDTGITLCFVQGRVLGASLQSPLYLSLCTAS